MTKAFLIDYDWCTGCHACEVACQMLHQLPPDQFGMKLNDLGPWSYGAGKWQFDYVPLATDQCSGCSDRVAKGKLPSCVQHCQTGCLRLGDIDELYPEFIKKPKQILQLFPAGF